MSMTRDKLNKLRAKSHFLRDLYYLYREHDTWVDCCHNYTILENNWREAQAEAETAVLEWIAQDCMEHINFGTGRCYINGKEVFTIKAVSYKFDPHP